ncbi:hypothetical protein B0A52_02824 [Exophiala mesophila]|uniref:Uncharacterized protein n=1 Tax=Exophiala mesophila TaxID=212818 RepID=A0A438NDR8_EXOME|nr:hypothetical protein B0A52_02824 [Exophiala mesophila]
MKSDLKADIKTLRSDMPSILDSVLESRKCKFQNRILFFVLDAMLVVLVVIPVASIMTFKI